MEPIDVLRKEVKKLVDKADNKTLRIVKAVMEIAMEEDRQNNIPKPPAKARGKKVLEP